jgi:hypothetical protein
MGVQFDLQHLDRAALQESGRTVQIRFATVNLLIRRLLRLTFAVPASGRSLPRGNLFSQ